MGAATAGTKRTWLGCHYLIKRSDLKMIHIQDTPRDWPDHLHIIRDAEVPACVKAVMRPDTLREAKMIWPEFFTILRHWNDSLQHYDGNADFDVWVERARHWFSTHVDGTFRRDYAMHTNAVSWHNEIWANSQNDHERYERIVGTRAALEVWNNEYRTQPEFEHIKLVVGEAAVGNWIPKSVMAMSIEYDAILGYHPYSAYGWDNPRERWPHDWENLSGLWDVMEHEYGLRPTWAFTEAGPYSGPVTGWRASEVCGGSLALYVQAVRDWLRDVQNTPAYNEDRIVGLNLFTTGGGDQWKTFETRAAELNALAEMYVVEWDPGSGNGNGGNGNGDDDTGSDDPTWEEYAWRESVDRQPISLNPNAALQKEMFWDNFTPVQSEFRLEHGGERRAVQAAEDPFSGERRVYWATVGDWGNVRWFDDPDRANVEVIVDKLEKNPNSPWYPYRTRPIEDITTLVVHHTVSVGTPEQFAHYHCNSKANGQGWPGIGYHYVINQDGIIFQTNYHKTISFHGNAANPYSVGIAMVGDFRTRKFAGRQANALRTLVRLLGAELPNVQKVIGHRQAPGAGTVCPASLMNHMVELNELL